MCRSSQSTGDALRTCGLRTLGAEWGPQGAAASAPSPGGKRSFQRTPRAASAQPRGHAKTEAPGRSNCPLGACRVPFFPLVDFASWNLRLRGGECCSDPVQTVLRARRGEAGRKWCALLLQLHLKMKRNPKRRTASLQR